MSLHADARQVLAAWRAPDTGQDDLRTTYLAHLDARPDAMSRDCHPDHLTGSALIVSADRRHVLLVRHRKAGLWLQTGGHCEPEDPTLAGTALREATEESGIDGLTIDPVPLLLSRHRVPFCGPVQPAHHLDVQYLAMAPPGAAPAVEAGADPADWFPVEKPPEPTDQDVRDLIAAARSRLGGTPSP